MDGVRGSEWASERARRTHMDTDSQSHEPKSYTCIKIPDMDTFWWLIEHEQQKAPPPPTPSTFDELRINFKRLRGEEEENLERERGSRNGHSNSSSSRLDFWSTCVLCVPHAACEFSIGRFPFANIWMKSNAYQMCLHLIAKLFTPALRWHIDAEFVYIWCLGHHMNSDSRHHVLGWKPYSRLIGRFHGQISIFRVADIFCSSNLGLIPHIFFHFVRLSVIRTCPLTYSREYGSGYQDLRQPMAGITHSGISEWTVGSKRR